MVKRKKVWVELRTVIDDEGDKELSIIKQTGTYLKRGNIEVINFVDVMDDFGEVNNYITIQPGKVNINRSGAINMNQQFLLHKITECLYQYPYGRLHLEITTNKMEQTVMTKEQAGQTIIEYDGVLNGDLTRQHHLTLTYMEEEAK